MNTNTETTTTETTAAAKKAFPAAHFNGRLAADAVIRYIPSKKEGVAATAVLEFKIIANPVRAALKPVGIRCSIIGDSRIEAAKAKLTQGALVEVSGDLVAEAYLDKETQTPRASTNLEIAFGKLVTLEAGKSPVKESLFAKEEASE